MSNVEGLVAWVQTFRSDIQSLDELCDGSALVEIYEEITKESDETWNKKSDMSWLEVVTYLKTLVGKIEDYFVDTIGIRLALSDYLNLVDIAKKKNTEQVAKLLEVMVYMATKCEDKEMYIQKIMDMNNRDYQTVLMHAIENVDNLVRAQESGEFSAPIMHDDEIDVQQPSDAKQRDNNSHELQETIDELRSVVKKLEKENARLRDGMETSNGNKTSSDQVKVTELEDQARKLKEDLAKTTREAQTKIGLAEDRTSEVESELRRIQAVMEGTNQANDETIQRLEDHIKIQADELDMSRAKASQLTKLEAKISKYQQRIEEIPLLKQQMQILEDKNNEYLEKYLDQEASLSVKDSIEAELRVTKDKVVELEAQLSAANAVAEVRKKEAEKGRSAAEKLPQLQQEKHELEQQLEAANDEIIQLKSEIDSNGGNSSMINMGGSLSATSGVNDMDHKEQVKRLEREIAKLKSVGDPDLLSKLEESNKLKERFEKSANEAIARVAELETKLGNDSIDLTEEASALRTKLQSENKALIEQVAKLQKDLEHVAQQEQRRSSEADMEKDAVNTAVQEDLKAKLKEKEAQCTQLTMEREKLENYVRQNMTVTQTKYKAAITTMKDNIKSLEGQTKELEKEVKVREQLLSQRDATQKREERLMMSAFYEIGLDIHRRLAFPATSKANTANSPAHHQPTSWLGKGRNSVSGGGSKLF